MNWIKQQDQSKVAKAMGQMDERGWTLYGTDWLKAGNGDREFALWLFFCERKMLRATGVGMFDIEDWGWADAFESEMAPSQAVRAALKSDSTYQAMAGL